MEQINTNRLMLRRFQPEDWKDLYEYLSDRQVVYYEPYDVYTEEACKEEAIKRTNNNSFWAVILKESNKLIGNIYFNQMEFQTWELGYVFNRNYQGKGYATEGTKAVIDYAISQLDARRIIAKCNTKNIASWKLMERLYMRREGHYKEIRYFKKDENGNPIWIDAFEYAILEKEWMAKDPQL